MLTLNEIRRILSSERHIDDVMHELEIINSVLADALKEHQKLTKELVLLTQKEGDGR
jgi:hypothetical protein